jgi:hypothetical protein
LRWGLGARRGRYLYKRELRIDQASGDLMEVWLAASIERVHDLILEGLIRMVQKSKKPMDNRNAGASDGHQEEERKRTHGEMLRRAL